MAPTEVLGAAALAHGRCHARQEPRPPPAAHRGPDAARAAGCLGRHPQGGDVDLVIGTQALVQDDVQFAKLGFVVIDEQHKFGVHQRARIRKLGGEAHYLS